MKKKQKEKPAKKTTRSSMSSIRISSRWYWMKSDMLAAWITCEPK